MTREVWEFMSDGKHHVIRKWLKEETISSKDQARLDLTLDRLRTLDVALISHKLMAGPLRGSKVYKLRLRCENKELRPMLCRGPGQVGPPTDYTLLLGAREAGDRLYPADAPAQADKNRITLIANRTWRERYS